MANLVPPGVRALTIRSKDVRVGDVLEDRETGTVGEVVAVHVTYHAVILEMRDALDWRLRDTDLVQLRYRAC